VIVTAVIGVAALALMAWYAQRPGGPVDQHRAKEVLELAGLIGANPPVIVRSYRGYNADDAVHKFEREAPNLAQSGYTPTGQTWAAGQWGCGAFFAALLLTVVGIGVLILLYMLIVKPEGTLTVTYTPTVRPPPAPVEQAADSSLTGRLAQLDAARDAGLISAEEHAAQRRRIIDSV
jgi:Flp pilus assembly protein TadB